MTKVYYKHGFEYKFQIVGITGRGVLKRMDDNKIILHNVEGVPFEFAVLDKITYKTNEYAVLIPTKVYTEQVTILQYEKKDGFDNYSKVSDDGIVNDVFKIFIERAKEALEE